MITYSLTCSHSFSHANFINVLSHSLPLNFILAINPSHQLIPHLPRISHCRTDVHVEREDEHWQFAANLVLELESVSFAFLSKAFLAKQAPPSLVNKPSGDPSDPFFSSPYHLFPFPPTFPHFAPNFSPLHRVFGYSLSLYMFTCVL